MRQKKQSDVDRYQQVAEVPVRLLGVSGHCGAEEEEQVHLEGQCIRHVLR